MEPDGARASLPHGIFDQAEQLAAGAAAAHRRENFDGLNVGDDPAGLPFAVGDGKAGHLPSVICNPGYRCWAFEQTAHVPAGKAERRRKADLFDGVERGEVVEMVW